MCPKAEPRLAESNIHDTVNQLMVIYSVTSQYCLPDVQCLCLCSLRVLSMQILPDLGQPAWNVG